MSEEFGTAQEAIQLAMWRRMARRSFLAWCELVLHGEGRSPARHHRLLIEHLQAVADGRCDRLMVQMPPGSAKSMYSSVLFPPFFMATNPGSQIIAASGQATLGLDFSDKVQRLIDDHQAVLQMKRCRDNKELWDTDNKSRYRSVGVGSGISGFRSSLSLIDDPFPSWEDADSPAFRKKVYDWYRGDIVNRQFPGGRIVIIMTRWHEDDLVGRLLADDAKRWTVLRLPQLSEGESDPLGRAAGDVLWPEWEDAAAVAAKRKEGGERNFAAQHQQSPGVVGGLLFDVTKLKEVGLIPPGSSIRSWDLAATEKVGTRDPDYTVGTKLILASSGEIVPAGSVVVEDVVREQSGPQRIEQLIVETARKDGPTVPIYIPQDPAQSGKWQISFLTRSLHGYTIISTPARGNKATRAMPLASQMNNGNVYLLKAPWNRAFKDEFEVFPGGRHDDQVDSAASGYGVLIGNQGRGTVTVQKLGY